MSGAVTLLIKQTKICILNTINLSVPTEKTENFMHNKSLVE